MKNVRRLHQLLLLTASALGAASGALAQTAPATPATPAAGLAPTPDAAAPATGLAFNVGALSDYRYRGISQSHLNPALSGGVDYTHASGLYVGTWVSTIRWIRDAGGSARAEWDVYGGYKGSAGPLGYDVGVLRYQYLRHALPVSPNTTEVYGALSWNVLTLKYSHALSNLFGFDNSRHSGYLDLSASFDLGHGFSLAPHVGHQWVRHNGQAAYTDLSLTLGKDFGHGLSGSLALVGTDASRSAYQTPGGRFTGRTGVVLGVKYTF